MGMQNFRSTTTRQRGAVLILLVIGLLAGLPVAVWLDLRNLTENALLRQASDLNSVVSSVRSYYGANVVGRVLAAPGTVQVTHNYESIPGAIPIPATLSLELGRVISEQQHNITYRFVSDFPFANRSPHVLDFFEAGALAELRENPNQQLSKVSWSLFSDRVRLIAPVIMGAACVNCHNSHPESPKRDWSRRCARHPGDHGQSGDRQQPIFIQIFAGLFYIYGGDRNHLHRHAAAPGSNNPRHE
jgi:adenylate cyclase